MAPAVPLYVISVPFSASQFQFDILAAGAKHVAKQLGVKVLVEFRATCKFVQVSYGDHGDKETAEAILSRIGIDFVRSL